MVKVTIDQDDFLELIKKAKSSVESVAVPQSDSVKKGKKRSPKATEEGVKVQEKEKKLTEFNVYMQTAVKKVKEEHPDEKNNRKIFQMAVARWNAHKAAKAADSECPFVPPCDS